MLISIDGETVPPQEAKIDIVSDSVLFGIGVFETLRTFKNRKLFRLERHIDRLLRSAATVSIPVRQSHAEICDCTTALVARSEAAIQRVKVVAFKSKLVVISTPLVPDRSIYDGVSLKSVTMRRTLPEIKATSYLDCLLAHGAAREQGCYEALLVDDAHYVYEGSRSNLFWVENRRLFTRMNRVLPGITRETITEELSPNVQSGHIRLSHLQLTDEVFITNSIIGICPVLKIDGRTVGSGSVGNMTNDLKKRYDRLTGD